MRARAPASSANLGPGFDTLAVALGLYVEVVVEPAERLSVRLDTAKAMRAGMLALMTPVMTFTLGRWVATIRWMPTARAFWAIRVIESSTSRAATIMRSLSSSTTTTMKGSRS